MSNAVLLPSGRLLSFDKEKHIYTIRHLHEAVGEGVIVPGITRLGKRHDLIEQRATPEQLEKGNRIHQAQEYDIEGDLHEPSVLPEERGYLEARRAIVKKLGLQLARAEILVGSDLWWFATKVDAGGFWNGAHTIVNWKTGGTMPKWYPVQLHLEALLFQQPIEHMLSIYLDADGSAYHVDHASDRKARKLARSIATTNAEAFAWRLNRAS